MDKTCRKKTVPSYLIAQPPPVDQTAIRSNDKRTDQARQSARRLGAAINQRNGGDGKRRCPIVVREFRLPTAAFLVPPWPRTRSGLSNVSRYTRETDTSGPQLHGKLHVVPREAGSYIYQLIMDARPKLLISDNPLSVDRRRKKEQLFGREITLFILVMPNLECFGAPSCCGVVVCVGLVVVVASAQHPLLDLGRSRSFPSALSRRSPCAHFPTTTTTTTTTKWKTYFNGAVKASPCRSGFGSTTPNTT